MRKSLGINLSYLVTVILLVTANLTWAEALYGPVKPEETLESIAQKYAKPELSTAQWTVAFWSLNIDQFETQNIYGMRTNIMLNVPTEEDVAKIPKSMAEATIAEHAKSWHELFNYEDIEDITNEITHPDLTLHTPPVVEQPYQTKTTSILSKILTTLTASMQTIITQKNIPYILISLGSFIILCIARIAFISEKKEHLERIRERDIPLSRGSSPNAAFDGQENSGDYNIFATPEGVNIKLDLAQAYINMQDLEGAKNILQEIIINHHGKAVTHAKELLNKLHCPELMLEEPTTV